MTGGSAIINTNSWAVELNGQHELYESDLETKYIHPKLDLVTTRFSELHDLVNKTQLPSYFIVYQYSI